jgi:hypothetical protein
LGISKGIAEHEGAFQARVLKALQAHRATPAAEEDTP